MAGLSEDGPPKVDTEEVQYTLQFNPPPLRPCALSLIVPSSPSSFVDILNNIAV